MRSSVIHIAEDFAEIDPCLGLVPRRLRISLATEVMKAVIVELMGNKDALKYQNAEPYSNQNLQRAHKFDRALHLFNRGDKKTARY